MNKASFLIVIISLVSFSVYSQEKVLDNSTEQQLENLTELEEAETEDDSFLQTLEFYKNRPLNLNYANENELKDFRLLSAIQISNLLKYRRLLGLLINVYELQAIPGWNIQTIRNILPFITVSSKQDVISSIRERWKGGERTILGRTTYVLEKAKGYQLRDSTGITNYYRGGRERLLLRYKYQYRNLLQYGFTAEKDPGEQFFKQAQQKGFDFYSAHLFVRNIGIVKALAIGDYTVNLGQGLIHWQNLAFKKSVEVMNIKRQSSIIRPYTSTGEFYFHRGAAVTFQKRNLELTLFGSYRKLDGNVVLDTLNKEDFFSSILKTGYHRSKSETEDMNTVHQFAWGGNLSYSDLNEHIGLNSIVYKYNDPIQKKDEPYNRFAINGNNWFNISMDYSFTRKNAHFFGETAISKNGGYATINGMLVSVANSIDLSLLYRFISKSYQSVYGNAFTESSLPSNESGFYTGIEIRPISYLKIDAYADIFHFPWLRYRVDASSYGTEYLFQVMYRPNKVIEIYSQFKNEKKELNFSNGTPLDDVVLIPKKAWRTQVFYKISDQTSLRFRVENLWFEHPEKGTEEGFLSYFDLIYKPMLSRLSGSLRLQYFETESYNSRVYSYENDLLYSFSIPAFFNKGYRWYINLNYDLNKFISCWFRISQSVSGDQNYFGSGLDEIRRKHRTELKLQFMWRIN